MATVTMTYVGPADGNPSATITHQVTIPDAAAPTIFAAYRASFGQIQSTDANGVLLWQNGATQRSSATSPGLGWAPVMRAMTDAETFDKYGMGIADGTVALAQRYAQQQAAAAAAAGVPTFTVTKTG